MSKVGRNARCPCGSGKKYKGCCGSTSAAAEPARPGAGVKRDSEVAAGIPGMTAYSIARITGDPRFAQDNPQLRALVERGIRESWTIDKVASMSTAQIEDQLRAFGVVHSRRRFVELSSSTSSAWSISEDWLAADPINCRGKEEDFLGLAACELWKRYGIEPASVEMIDDWMQEGYALLERNKGDEACDVWWRVWCALRPRFGSDMTTMNDVFAVFQGTQSVFNWSQDFETSRRSARRPRPCTAEPWWSRRVQLELPIEQSGLRDRRQHLGGVDLTLGSQSVSRRSDSNLVVSPTMYSGSDSNLYCTSTPLPSLSRWS